MHDRAVGHVEEARSQLGNRGGLSKSGAAGTMASRNGNPKVTPAPFSTALREICFFVMNMFPYSRCLCVSVFP